MSTRRSLISIFSILGLLVASMILHSQANAGDDASALTITSGTSAPEAAAPADVLTFRVSLKNNSQRLENLQVKLKVLGPEGEEVLLTEQGGINVSKESNQAIYWVWRTPANLQEGEYRLLASVEDKSGTRVLVGEKELASFELARGTVNGYQTMSAHY